MYYIWVQTLTEPVTGDVCAPEVVNQREANWRGRLESRPSCSVRTPIASSKRAAHLALWSSTGAATRRTNCPFCSTWYPVLRRARRRPMPGSARCIEW